MTINHVSVNKLVEFKKLTERSQVTFANNLKKPKKPKLDDEESDGGNYWQRCLSGVSTAFKENNNSIIKERIDSLLTVYETCDKNQVRSMYKRNLAILKKYEEFDFSIWNPPVPFKYHSKTRTPLTFKKIPLKVLPQHVYSYGGKENPTMGGIFFVTSVQGYSIDDLGIFSEAIYKYLYNQHPEDYYIDPKYCITVDASTMEVVRYQEILDGKIPSLLQKMLDKLNTLI